MTIKLFHFTSTDSKCLTLNCLNFQQLRKTGHLGEQGATSEAAQRQDQGGPAEVRRHPDQVFLQRDSGLTFCFEDRIKNAFLMTLFFLTYCYES